MQLSISSSHRILRQKFYFLLQQKEYYHFKYMISLKYIFQPENLFNTIILSIYSYRHMSLQNVLPKNYHKAHRILVRHLLCKTIIITFIIAISKNSKKLIENYWFQMLLPHASIIADKKLTSIVAKTIRHAPILLCIWIRI